VLFAYEEAIGFMFNAMHKVGAGFGGEGGYAMHKVGAGFGGGG
jgi:hypothetical protein